MRESYPDGSDTVGIPKNIASRDLGLPNVSPLIIRMLNSNNTYK